MTDPTPSLPTIAIDSGADAVDLELFRSLVATIEYGMLATHAADGTLVARPLQTMQVDDNGALWFFTARGSEKVAHIARDPRVNLSYADIAAKTFASIEGTATVLSDPTKAAELWRVAQRIFFPLGPEDPTLALLRIEPRIVRTWDGNESPFGTAQKFASALLRGEASDLGDCRKLDVGPSRT